MQQCIALLQELPRVSLGQRRVTSQRTELAQQPRHVIQILRLGHMHREAERLQSRQRCRRIAAAPGQHQVGLERQDRRRSEERVGAGAIAQRAFVGDRDGGVWRVDFSSPDPTKWRMDLVIDTCPGSGSGGITCTYGQGQPIATPPALSVDRVGNVTISVATGDQETFTATGTNWVWSFTELPDATHSSPIPPYSEQAAWYVQLTNGERVSGPMTLFNSVLYFSSFAPGSPSSNVCSAGVSRLWGVDYITAATTGTPSSGPVARLEKLDTSGNVIAGQFVTNQSLGDGTIVFGVGVTQKPSCADTSTGTTDPYIGAGTHYGFSSMSSGQFQLVVQTGWGGKSVNNAITKTMTRQMASPPSLTRIDSWAAVVDP